MPTIKLILEYDGTAYAGWQRQPDARTVQDALAAAADAPGYPVTVGLPETRRAALDWLGAAQDRSASADGGAARHYSLVQGWGPSYPETTGYIVPTLLAAGERLGDAALTARGRITCHVVAAAPVDFPPAVTPGGRRSEWVQGSRRCRRDRGWSQPSRRA